MSSHLLLPQGIEVIERGWLSANSIFISNSDETIIIDTGYVSHAAFTLSLIKHQLDKYHHGHLSKVLNTHLHSDHCGGNAVIQSHYPVDTYIPSAEQDHVLNWNRGSQSHFDFIGQRCPSFAFTHTLNEGDQLQLAGHAFHVLSCPGHHPHAVMLFNDKHGILITGDALWQDGFGIVFPELIEEDGFDDVQNTLNLISDLDVKLVLPGHGPIFSDVSEALDRAQSRLKYLSEDISRNARHGAKVLLKFVLQEWHTIDLALAQQWIKETPIMSHIAKQLDLSLEELADWLPPALVKAGGAQLNNQQLINTN